MEQFVLLGSSGTHSSHRGELGRKEEDAGNREHARVLGTCQYASLAFRAGVPAESALKNAPRRCFSRFGARRAVAPRLKGLLVGLLDAFGRERPLVGHSLRID